MKPVPIILVTGATGFIGRNCLELFSGSDYDLHVVTRSKEKARSLSGCSIHEVDLLDNDAVRELIREVKPSHLLHLAWNVKPGISYESEENYLWLGSGIELLRAFVKEGGQRAVVSGSGTEYDWSYGYCSESTPLRAKSLYSACKAAYFSVFSEVVRSTNLSGAWARPFFLYGPHEDENRLVPYVIRSLLQGEKANCSHGMQIRDFTYSKDAARAIVSLLLSDHEGVFNIGTGKPVTLREIVNSIATKLSSPDSVSFGAVPARSNESELVIANIGKIRSDLSWRPDYSLDAGLDETIAWWKKKLVES